MGVIPLRAQIVSADDKALHSFYKEAQFYKVDSLEKYLKLKEAINCFNLQKKDSFSVLDFCLEKSCVVRFIGFSFFDIKDSLSQINFIFFQLLNNPNIESAIITSKREKENNSKNKYNFAALDIAYLKKWHCSLKEIKIFALGEKIKDINPPCKDYIDLFLILK